MADTNNIIGALQIGLRTSSLRSRVIANNMANIDTPGFRRRAVAFEAHLADALQSGEPLDPDDVQAMIFRPGTTPVESNGNDVSIDMEVGEMVKNSARYKTYMRVMTKMYRQMEQAMITG